MPNIILGHTCMYIRRYRKVDLLSRTEKRYLWLAEVNFRNCLSITYMYTQRLPPSSTNNNTAPILRGCRICEKATKTRAKLLFSKFRISTPLKFTITDTKIDIHNMLCSICDMFKFQHQFPDFYQQLTSDFFL